MEREPRFFTTFFSGFLTTHIVQSDFRTRACIRQLEEILYLNKFKTSDLPEPELIPTSCRSESSKISLVVSD